MIRGYQQTLAMILQGLLRIPDGIDANGRAVIPTWDIVLSSVSQRLVRAHAPPDGSELIFRQPLNLSFIPYSCGVRSFLCFITRIGALCLTPNVASIRYEWTLIQVNRFPRERGMHRQRSPRTSHLSRNVLDYPLP
jgi:hypothetical protein